MLFLIYGRNLKITFSQKKKRLYFDIKFAIQSRVHSKWIFKEIFWGYFGGVVVGMILIWAEMVFLFMAVNCEHLLYWLSIQRSIIVIPLEIYF